MLYVIKLHTIVEDEDMNSIPVSHVKRSRIYELIHNIFDYYGKVTKINVIIYDYIVIMFKPHGVIKNMDSFMDDDIIEAGPDTWMEGDISIGKGDLIDTTYFKDGKYYEFKIMGYLVL